ncbi:SMP-30/gluconolactonase/LRE family protein [Microvirga aerilata]|uniref:SMP-30/gluconolactonase/LRE family protein n=1 Tax=Microvirga aerilata TaxID=670292 RepID=UPI001FE272C7|nr:SMP-30/gluconolactonase/LRE family protein [Microvirga aerilata]
MLRIEVVNPECNQLGEGPLWDLAEQALYWIDSYGPAVYRIDSQGRRTSWALPEHVGSIALREQGGIICSLRSGFHALDVETGKVTLVAQAAPENPRTRINDGKVDRQGRFVAGTMDYEERDPLCALYRLDPDLSVTQLDDGIICSNGPCWSLDGTTLYFADTTKRLIYAYDYDPRNGATSNKRIFADFAAHDLLGYPDGATVDAEGYLWSCEVYRGRLVRFRPDGTLDRVVGLPVDSATSLIFGGPNLDVAYVTSMARPIGGKPPREKEAGMLFAVYGLGVKGVPEPRFAG